MNGAHDMGGMQGFGPVIPEKNEPIFHARWEARMLALNLATAGWKKWNLDAVRFAREQAPPADYLRFSYFERWYAGLCRIMLQTGLISADELASGEPQGARLEPPIKAGDVPALLDRGGPTLRDVKDAPRFAIGQAVRSKNIHPEGHTRLPRYARGRRGVIHKLHGAHVLPDSNARFKGEAPEPLYNVLFEAAELWGPEAAFRGTVHIDLWESYLEAL